MTDTQASDDFEEQARASLQGPGAEGKIQKLMALRAVFMAETENLSSKAHSAEQLNKMYTSFLHQAASVLGKEDFERVFEVPLEDEMNIVDPNIYERAHN